VKNPSPWLSLRHCVDILAHCGAAVQHTHGDGPYVIGASQCSAVADSAGLKQRKTDAVASEDLMLYPRDPHPSTRLSLPSQPTGQWPARYWPCDTYEECLALDEAYAELDRVETMLGAGPDPLNLYFITGDARAWFALRAALKVK
jgi:hypothetical protein